MPATAVLADPATGDRAARALIGERLRSLRAREFVQSFANRFAIVLLLGTGALVAVAAAGVFLRGGSGSWPARDWRLGVAAVVGGSLLGAGVSAWFARPSLAATARLIDRRAGARDRLATALALSERPPEGGLRPVERLAWEECTRFARAFPVRRWTPFSFPRAARFLPVPAFTLAFLLLRGTLPGLGGPGAPTPDPALQQTLTAQAAELKRAADAAARRADDPAAKLLAEELERAARRLQEAAGRRDALRELSALEARLKQMQSERPSPAELAALAAALRREGSEAALAAAEALRKGDPEEAARQLEKLLEQLKAGRDDRAAAETLAQLARSMKEQAEKLTPEQRGAVSRQMQQAAAEAAEAQKNAGLLQKISELLREAAAQNAAAAAGNRGGTSGGSPGAPGSGKASVDARQLTTQQLQSLLQALENMKNGLNGGGQPDGPGQPGGGGLTLTLDDFGKPPGPGTARAGNAPGGAPGPQPGGAPGSEQDAGTSPLGEARVADQPIPDRATRLQGQLGAEGDSLQDFVPTTSEGVSARSRREFREGVERAQSQAQEAIQQENIPLGSRFLVERYFKNIRPAE